MWNPVRKQRGLYTIPRLRIGKEGYAITEELKNISGSKCALKAFNETIENQVNGKNADYSQESIIVRDQNGGERIANGYDVCRSLGEVVNCTLVFDTGYAFNNGDKLKACLKIHPNKDRQNRCYPYVADLCWQAWGDAGRKNVFPACVANLDNVAKIIACIYGGVEKTARVAIHYAFLTMSEDDVGLGKTWVALDKCDIELSFAECNGKSRFPCYVIDARALRENPLCPAIYRSLPISLGLLRDSSLLEKLQRLLPDTDERFPCGWNHWVETEKGFSCDGPVGCSLAYYLEGVLERLCADRDSDSNASGAFVDDVDRSGFWFCTGLVGKTGDFLYGHVCKSDDDGFCQHIEWYTSNDKALPNQHPVSPDWTRSAQELVYNRALLAKIALKEAVWHVWDKHRERLPL